MRDLRMLLPAAAAWVTAWLVVAAPDAGVDPNAVVWSIWVAGVIVLVLVVVAGARGRLWHRTHKRRWGTAGRRLLIVGPSVVVVLAASGLAASTAAIALGQRADSPLAAAAAEHRTVEVVVDVVAAPRAMRAPAWGEASEHPALRVDARLVMVDGHRAASVAVTTSLSLPPGQAQLGTRLAFDAHATRLPAGEESAFRLRAGEDIRVLGSPPPWLGWASGLRAGFAEAARTLGGDGAALVPGLAIGDTGAVGGQLDAAMKASSLSHLTAVSGANCAIVTAAAFALAALCGLPRRVRVVVALTALAAFVVLVTPQPSVVRAGAMAIVVLVAIAAGRPGGGVAALSVAVTGLLAFDPWLARDYGFALSAAATAGLLLLAAPLASRLARIMPVPLAAVLAVPIAAQLACQPILVLLDPAIALYGVPANLLAAPAAPLGTVVGLLGCLILPVLPSVGVAFLQVAWVPASWIAMVARGAAGLPGGRLPWLPDAAGAVLLVLCTALALWLALSPDRRPRLRAGAAAILAVAFAVPLGISVGGPLVGSATRPDDWDVAMCDVGQGDAVFVRSEGQIALVDTGREPAPLEQCRAFLGIERIDLLVLTHWDADHIGGVEAIVGRVATVIHAPLDGRRSSRVMDPLVRAGAHAVEVTKGDHGTLGDARWTVLWPEPGIPPDNDGCVVLEIDAPGYTGAFLCDLGEDSQERVLATGDIDEVDLVKVAHHGSADQSVRIYEQLDAGVGIIGVGTENGYGHPTDRILDILARVGTTAVRTDLSGTIVLSADGDGGFRLWSERGGVGGGP